MDVKQYEERREKLVELIDRGLALRAGIPDKTSDALAEIRRKVFENQFRIVLVSGFECGKSTTFNMLCGGQEISPRGLMVPTSATVVSAQNTLDQDRVGTASVVWRTDRELTMIFAKQILRIFKKIDEKRFGGIQQADDLCDELSYPEDIPLLKKAVAKQVGEILDNRSHGILNDADNDALRMAYIISNFYGNPLIEELKARKSFPVAEVAKLITFPRKFVRDWMHSEECAYKPEECVFAFVRQVHCYVQSEYLARTGSVLIDCPGLFSSSYDTAVAYEILENADAVWYIFNGMAIGQTEMKALKQIMAAKPNSIFYTVNLLAAPLKMAQDVGIPECIQRIKQETGIELKGSEFHYYNAFLALSALEMKRAKNDKLSAHDINEIRRIYDHQNSATINDRYYGQLMARSPEGMIDGNIARALISAYGINWSLLLGAGVDPYAECLNISGIDDILGAVENEVLARKAKSILIDNGSHKAIELIKSVENELVVAESVLRNAESERSEAYESAKKKLEEFKDFCNKCLDRLRDDAIDHALALDYWNEVINSSTDEVAEAAAEKIVDYDLNELRQGLSEQIVNDTFAEIVKPKATAWANQIKNGMNGQFNKLVGSVMKGIIEDTSKKWEVIIKDEPMLENLPTPMPVSGIDVLNTELIDRVVATAPGVSPNIIVGSTVGATIGALIGSWVFPGVGTYIGGVLGATLGAVFQGGLNRSARQQQICESLKSELRKFVADPVNVNDIVRKQQVRIEELRTEIIQAFNTAFGEPMNTLTEQYNAAERLLADASIEKEELIRKNQSFREETLVPLRAEIQHFESEVLKDCRLTEK